MVYIKDVDKFYDMKKEKNIQKRLSIMRTQYISIKELPVLIG